MNPLLIIFLAIAIPAGAALIYIFVRGSASLRRYIITRIALTLPMVIILASVVFIVLRILPGDPVTSSLGPRGSPALRASLQQQFGLDDSIVVQYGRYMGSLLTFDLGDALTSGRRPVADELGERFPATFELIIPAALLALAVGIIPGTLAAARRRKPSDYGLRIYSVVIYSIPIFWLGLLLQLVFGVWLGWLPVAGRVDPVISGSLDRQTNMVIVDSIISGNWTVLWSALRHLVLPTLTLGLVLSGVFLRLTRINVIETLQEDYITAARARGVREHTVVYRHALHNALIPVVTLIGLQVAILLGGAVLTETVFSWPGVGSYLVERIGLRDYTAVQGVIAVFAMFVALISLAVDILYSLLDPRVRY